MMPMTQNADPAISALIQKALEEKGINPRAYEIYLLRKYGNNLKTIL